ncbi:MAG: type 1 glutamine amidotransferase [bacterium]
MRVAIIENTAITHHGQVGVALHEAGARIEIFRPWRDGHLPQPGDHDAMVAFGGEQSALSDDTHPYLPALAHLMAATAATDRAVLGICLGAQVLARGLGAQNLIGTVKEVGWHQVTKTSAAQEDPVLGHLPDTFPIFEWHSDTFTLPPDTQHLATSPIAPAQCFRVHRAGYGMQFHFEASRAVVADWTATFPELLEGHVPGWVHDLPARAATQGQQADHHGLTIARAWVALI